MPESMIYAEQEFTVGQQTTVECQSPSTAFTVVFEDDTQTAYLYGLDTALKDNPILDALHIYNADNVKDKHILSFVTQFPQKT